MSRDRKCESYLTKMGEFPLHVLIQTESSKSTSNNTNGGGGAELISFSREEEDFIQTIYSCFLLTEVTICENEDRNLESDLPPPCIGTAAELWCIIQIYFQWNINIKRFCLFDLRTKTSHYRKQMPEPLQEELLQCNWTVSPTTRVIMQKISRRPLFDFSSIFTVGRGGATDDEYFNVWCRNEESVKDVANMISSKATVYGEFPLTSSHFEYAFSNLTEKEAYAVNLTYIKIVWAYIMKKSEFLIPYPQGTGMEVYLMMRIVKDLLMELLPRRATSTLNNMILDEYMNTVYKDQEEEEAMEMVKEMYGGIEIKLSMSSFRNYMLPMDRNMAFAMSRHCRLGGDSAANMLSDDVIKKIIVIGGGDGDKSIEDPTRHHYHLPVWWPDNRK